MRCHPVADVMSAARQEANDRGFIARHGMLIAVSDADREHLRAHWDRCAPLGTS